MTVRSERILFLAVIAALALAGCSSKETTTADDSLQPDEIMRQVDALPGSIETFSAYGSFSVETPQMSQSAGFDLAVKKPDSVMIVVEGPFGIMLGKALFTGNSFTAYSALNNTVYQGNPRAGMRSLPFFSGIDAAVIIDALSGIRRFGAAFSESDSFVVGKNSYIITLARNPHRTKYFVDALSFLITRVVTYGDDGSVLWEERYTYSRAMEGRWQPSTTRITVPGRSMTVEFNYDEITLNGPLPAFTVGFPADAARITID